MQRQAVDLFPEMWYNAFERSVYTARNYLLTYAEQLATDVELLYKTNSITEAEYKTLDTACTSIRVMLISSINTAKENK